MSLYNYTPSPFWKDDKAVCLTTKQVESIFDFAAQAAEDNGLMSHYVFRRAIMVFAASVLYPDKTEEITSNVGPQYDISAIYDKLNEDGFIETMYTEHQDEIDYLLTLGEEWFDDTQSYVHSARGLLDALNTMSGDIVKSAYEKLQAAAQVEDVKDVLRIGEALGVSRRQDTSIRDSGKLHTV